MMYSDLIQAAIDGYDFDGLELWCGKKYDFCKQSLEEIDQFDVSPEMQPTKNEDKLALQDSKQAAYYCERWVKYRDSDDIDMCVSYGESAIEHAKKGNTLLDELLSEITTPTPTPTATPTPTPTPTPHMEKDTDSDGVPDKYDYAPNDPNVQTKEDVMPKETPTPTPTVPGFEAVFAIGSILAVAYLVLRRKR